MVTFASEPLFSVEKKEMAEKGLEQGWSGSLEWPGFISHCINVI